MSHLIFYFFWFLWSFFFWSKSANSRVVGPVRRKVRANDTTRFVKVLIPGHEFKSKGLGDSQMWTHKKPPECQPEPVNPSSPLHLRHLKSEDTSDTPFKMFFLASHCPFLLSSKRGVWDGVGHRSMVRNFSAKGWNMRSVGWKWVETFFYGCINV